ncbi:hypothetical protein NQ315_001463 [Exocentrus adspersus]|uniref:Ribonuclease H2 subunit B n=1 Tax=Exocentrus adspersus TaxID=1586481 RepID=A0AAV8W9L7_9CUCU|nr:hypothetical protein NQ315_001463 [Exocentrus adspersus]
MPPTKKKSIEKYVKKNVQEPTNSWVILLNEPQQPSDVKESESSGSLDIVTLRQPNTDKAAKFLFSSTDDSVQEILTFTEEKRSWLIDDTVKSNGQLHLSTPVDPIFLVLPYLQKRCTSEALPLEEMLQDKEFPETKRLLKLKSGGLRYLNTISDTVSNSFKFNEEKTLVWLKKKTEKVAQVIHERKIHVGRGSQISVSDSDRLRWAYAIIRQYLNQDIGAKLLKYLDIPEQVQNLKRKGLVLPKPDVKKAKLEYKKTRTAKK